MSGKRRGSLTWCIVVCLIASCTPKRLDLFTDAGQPTDSGTPDTGTRDTGEPDTGEPDTGAPDTGAPDAGEPDTGIPDAGEPDTGPIDSGADASDTGTDEPDATVPPPPPPVWTVLVYMAADNNLEKYAIDDLNEMLKANISDDIQLIVQIDRASGFYELGIGGVASWETMKRFRVRKNNLQELADLGEQDTGDPATLSDFLRWGFDTYPSERRMAILWNHGNAWQGYGGDESSGLDRLEQAELETAFGEALTGDTQKLDLIGFDACLMSTFVAAGAFKRHTDYFIASEELEPGHGWDYEVVLNDLANHPDRTVPALGETIVEAFYAQARAERKHNDITINLLDLTRYDAVRSAFDAFVTQLDAQLDVQKTNVSRARAKVVEYGEHSDPSHAYNMVDLGDFAKQLALVAPEFATSRDALLTSLDALVIASRYGRTKAASTGASIYFPTAKTFYKNGYDAIQEGIGWRDLLKELYALAVNPAAEPPVFVGQAAPSSEPGSLATDPALPAGATADCDPGTGPVASGDLNPSDVEKVATATLVSGLVDSRTGEVHVFSREPAAIDDGSGEITGSWDRHVLVANQGAKQQILFAEFDPTDEARFIVAKIPVMYSEPVTCPCAAPGAPGYSDVDNDGEPDCADGDVDADGVPDKGNASLDNCPWVPNEDQLDTNSNGTGDACEGGSQAPVLGCAPVPSGAYAELKPAFWRVTIDRLNGERYGATLYVASEAGVSEISPTPGALLWPHGLLVDGTGSLVWKTFPPLPFNLQQPVDFRYVDIEQLYVLNESGDPLLDSAFEPSLLTERLGWNDVFMRVFVSDFADRGGAAELRGDFSDCDPPALEFCQAPLVPDCDGECIDPNAKLPNGSCDDGSGGSPNLSCKLHNFDAGECARPDCDAGFIRDCEGKCTLSESVLGNGTCDRLARCEALEWDRGDCPCGPDCSGHGTCNLDICQCDVGYGGEYCETPPSCGDGTCRLVDGENCQTCADDCNACPTLCGDGTCSAKDGENCTTCASDCGACACGDDYCSRDTESCSTCSADCGACPTCGDFVCEAHRLNSAFDPTDGEHCGNCPTDCGACQGDCCVTSGEKASGYVGGGCADWTVSSCVCAINPTCCSVGWSGTCYEIARTSCGLTCSACPSTAGGDQDLDGICGDTDNCPLTANPEQQNEDQDTTGDACDRCPFGDDVFDPDRDGIASACDNCPNAPNAAQSDADDDGRGDVCDNCPIDPNNENTDEDQDGIGDACDNCPFTASSNRADTDGDGRGDVCDPCNDAIATPDSDLDGIQDSCDADDDDDGVLDASDNCTLTPNPDQTNTDLTDDGGDACDIDDDGDTVEDPNDNCPLVSNPEQTNSDFELDGGDACDDDDDNDGFTDLLDVCPAVFDPEQLNTDLAADGGDACDGDDDDDTILDGPDNCPLVANENQLDVDGDTIGDACDEQVFLHCTEIRQFDPGAASGDYYIDPDGPFTGNPPLLASCDMESAGGGWTLILNYLHQAGTSPELVVRTDTLPRLGASTLGTNESGTPFWGHASTFLVSRFQPTELRFYGATSAHSRVIHFTTDSSACLQYATSGEGSCANVMESFEGLPDHNAILPAGTNLVSSNQFDFALTEFPFTADPDARWSIRGGGTSWEADDFAAAQNSTLHRVWVRSLPTPDQDGDGVPDDFDNCVGAVNPDQIDSDFDGVGDACEESYPANCNDLLAQDPQAPSGSYPIDPDGIAGPLPPLFADCDMTTDGGGWTLVLNYLHQGGTNPPLDFRTDSLPLLGSSTLGTDESGTSSWGHGSNAIVDALGPTEFWFEGRTSGHPRVMSFIVFEPTCVSYLRTGSGTCALLFESYQTLPGHDSGLPGAMDSSSSNLGNAAMTDHTFYQTGALHWNINTSGRWEVDDFPLGPDNDTLHRIWAR